MLTPGSVVSSVPTITTTTTAVNVATTSGIALAADPAREFAIFINMDNVNIIFLKFGSAAVVNEGVYLAPKGGAYQMSRQEGNLSTEVVNAIHSGATGTRKLSVVSGVAV